MEVDYVASTIKLYGKSVSVGDTTALTTKDLIIFGGNDIITNAVQGTYAGDIFMYLGGPGADGGIDNIRITEYNLIRKIGTLMVVK